MKKWVLFLLTLFIVGCSNKDEDKILFSEDQAVPFEVIVHEQKMAPIFESMAPYILYAQTEGQLKELLARFDLKTPVDITTSDALFLVTYSDSCGIAVDGVYNKEGQLAVQLGLPEDVDAATACDKTGIPHTFLIEVDKQDYDKVQLYNGDIIKSSVEVKE